MGEEASFTLNCYFSFYLLVIRSKAWKGWKVPTVECFDAPLVYCCGPISLTLMDHQESVLHFYQTLRQTHFKRRKSHSADSLDSEAAVWHGQNLSHYF